LNQIGHLGFGRVSFTDNPCIDDSLGKWITDKHILCLLCNFILFFTRYGFGFPSQISNMAGDGQLGKHIKVICIIV
jgi:hypothetical protein